MSARLAWRRFFVLGVALAVASSSAARSTAGRFNRKLDIGQAAPAWNGLEGVDGQKHSLRDYKKSKVLVIVFTCNQCPVSQLYEERLIHLAKEFKSRDVTLVAISCSLLPADRLEKMKERARSSRFNFDYLTDPTQQTGKDYGATVTPQVFVLDQSRHVAYMGRFDDHLEPDQVRRRYAYEAVRDLLAGKQPEPSETRASGCGIEYGKPQSSSEGSGRE
jgi:peroxiredoxin